MAEKTLGNSDVNGTRKNVPDVQVFGDGDMFCLLCKASSQEQGWMKSTKAMEIPGVGCVVQVTTQQRNPDGSYAVAEAVTFVPGVRIVEGVNGDGVAENRWLESWDAMQEPNEPTTATQEQEDGLTASAPTIDSLLNGCYRKKPVVIQAWRWDGNPENSRGFECITVRDVANRHDAAVMAEHAEELRLIIPTLEGDHYAAPGDYIITGVKGEVYPCKADIFAATYDLAL